MLSVAKLGIFRIHQELSSLIGFRLKRNNKVKSLSKKGFPSRFLPIVPRNLYEKVKILSPRVYPFREMV